MINNVASLKLNRSLFSLAPSSQVTEQINQVPQPDEGGLDAEAGVIYASVWIKPDKPTEQ